MATGLPQQHLGQRLRAEGWTHVSGAETEFPLCCNPLRGCYRANFLVGAQYLRPRGNRKMMESSRDTEDPSLLSAPEKGEDKFLKLWRPASLPEGRSSCVQHPATAV